MLLHYTTQPQATSRVIVPYVAPLSLDQLVAEGAQPGIAVPPATDLSLSSMIKDAKIFTLVVPLPRLVDSALLLPAPIAPATDLVPAEVYDLVPIVKTQLSIASDPDMAVQPTLTLPATEDAHQGHPPRRRQRRQQHHRGSHSDVDSDDEEEVLWVNPICRSRRSSSQRGSLLLPASAVVPPSAAPPPAHGHGGWGYESKQERSEAVDNHAADCPCCNNTKPTFTAKLCSTGERVFSFFVRAWCLVEGLRAVAVEHIVAGAERATKLARR